MRPDPVSILTIAAIVVWIALMYLAAYLVCDALGDSLRGVRLW